MHYFYVLILDAVLLIFLLWLLARRIRKPTTFSTPLSIYLAIWLVSSAALAATRSISVGMPTTILIEGLGMLLYALIRRRPLFPMLSLMILVNVITQTLFLWIGFILVPEITLTEVILCELLIGLLEGWFYHLGQRQISLSEGLFLSFLLNGISFLVGWFF